MAENSETISGAIIGLVVILFASDVWTSGWFNKSWYALTYAVSPTEVHVDTRPADCDFLHSPLGSKGCHYDVAVTAFNANGDLVSGEGAPKYGHDSKTGLLIISWDQGKTWTWIAPTNVPDQKIKRVNVSWAKIAD